MLQLVVPNLKTIAAIASAVCAVSYAIYFDRKRHQDPLFKQKLRERRRKAAEENKNKNKLKIPELTTVQDFQEFGESLKSKIERLLEEGDLENAAEHIAAMITMSDQPQMLMSYYMKILPPQITTILPQKVIVVQERIHKEMTKSIYKEPQTDPAVALAKNKSTQDVELKLPENPTPDNMNAFCTQCLRKGFELASSGDPKGYELLAYALALSQDRQILLQMFHQDMDEESLAMVLAQLPAAQAKLEAHFAKLELPGDGLENIQSSGVLIEEELE